MIGKPFTPDVLRGLASRVSELRLGVLCDIEFAGADPEAEQLALQALSFLELGSRALAQAAIKQSQALAAFSR